MNQFLIRQCQPTPQAVRPGGESATNALPEVPPAPPPAVALPSIPVGPQARRDRAFELLQDEVAQLLHRFEVLNYDDASRPLVGACLLARARLSEIRHGHFADDAARHIERAMDTLTNASARLNALQPEGTRPHHFLTTKERLIELVEAARPRPIDPLPAVRPRPATPSEIPPRMPFAEPESRPPAPSERAPARVEQPPVRMSPPTPPMPQPPAPQPPAPQPPVRAQPPAPPARAADPRQLLEREFAEICLRYGAEPATNRADGWVVANTGVRTGLRDHKFDCYIRLHPENPRQIQFALRTGSGGPGSEVYVSRPGTGVRVSSTFLPAHHWYDHAIPFHINGERRVMSSERFEEFRFLYDKCLKPHAPMLNQLHELQERIDRMPAR